MTVNLSSLAGAGQQFFNNDGNVLGGGKLYSYQAGTTTPQTTYTTAAGSIAHSNPIILDANGRVNEVWLTSGVNYKFIIKDANDNILGTYDDLTGINDIASQINAIYANLANTADVAKGDALVGFKQANMSGVYGGAVGQTVHRKLQEQVSVFDFMTTAQIQDVQAGTSLLDVRTPINNAFAAILANGGGTLYFPKGTYRITGFIGQTTSPTALINLGIVAEPGTIINCDPAVYDNYAFYLQIQDLETLYISGFRVNCNNKVNIGFFVTSLAGNAIQDLVIENCQIYQCNAVNNPGSTRSVNGILISSGAWGFRAAVRNCYINGVSRDHWTGSQACQGLVIQGFEIMVVDSCTVENVTHNNQQLQDADGIVIFSFSNGGDFYKSTVAITNCNVKNCNGRLIKLQTEGSVNIENNYLSLTAATTLINNWKGIDSQVADMNCQNNYFFIDDAWSGGASANLVQLTNPATATVQYNNEGFFQKFNNNIVEVKKQMPYFCIPNVGSAQANQYLEICDNIVNYPLPLNTASSTAAFTDFIYLNNSSFAPLASVTGNIYWLISRNRVSTYNFIRIDATQEDYTGKWYVQIEDNFKASVGFTREIFYSGATAKYTSNIKIRDNMIGQFAGNFTWPSDSTKWLNGCDFSNGDTSAGVISPAPANYRNGRFYKHGGVLGVEVVAGGTGYHYISMDNGSNWYTT